MTDEQLDIALRDVRRTMDEHGVSGGVAVGTADNGTVYALHFAPGCMFEVDTEDADSVAVSFPDKGEESALASYVADHLELLRTLLKALAGLHLSCSQLEHEVMKLLRTSPELMRSLEGGSGHG